MPFFRQTVHDEMAIQKLSCFYYDGDGEFAEIVEICSKLKYEPIRY
jgi:hypothetical protein